MMKYIGLLVVSIAAAGIIWWTTRKPEAEPPAAPKVEPVFAIAPWFVDVTDEYGLDFVHDCGPVGTYSMIQQVGSGAALFDFNNDGLLDIYLLQNGGPQGQPNRLYMQTRDKQTGARRFVDASAGSGLDIRGHSMGVAIGDINNDGLLDVLVTQYDGVKLFLNLGDGKFKDVTVESGLSNPAWGTSAAFFDYDRDGWLDLVVVSYVDYDPTWPCYGPSGQRDYCAPKTFKGRVSRLFHNNNGKSGKNKSAVQFEDVTEASGLGKIPGPGLGVVCADFDGDGWPDIFIANDGAPNRLWINQQKNHLFKEEAVIRGIAYSSMGQAYAGMGIALGDVDGDGLFDIFVTHLIEETHTLWKQKPRGIFRDKTTDAGFNSSSWRGTGFGTIMADFDHDGALDLALANGRVAAKSAVDDWSLGEFWSYYGDRNQIFAGDGRGGFRDVSPGDPAFCGHYNVARGLVRGDIDGDGAQDLLVTTIGGRARIMRNIAPKRGHWLHVRAVDPAFNRDAYGAEIRVIADGRTWHGWLNPAESYLCSSEIGVHFGIGGYSRIQAIEILWPNGTNEVWERFEGIEVDKPAILRRGAGIIVKKIP